MLTLFCRIFQSVFGVVNRNLKSFSPECISGKGVFEDVAGIFLKNEKKNVFIVTGPRVSKSEYFSKMLEGLRKDNISYVLFDSVKADPPIEQIEEMLALYKKGGCDSILAVGGGSNMDAAKGVAARVARPNRSLKQLGGVMKVMKKTPFMVAVPTTAGTGSECTVAAVVTDTENNKKYAINDPVLCPDVAVLDPLLTLSLPAGLTAYTGMDALTHAVEAYLNKPYHKKNVTKKAAEDGVKGVYTYLYKAYTDGSDIEAREGMLKASFMAGMAFTVACVGNVHAMAHAVGGLYHVQHGLANAVILPYVLDEFKEKSKKDLADLARLVGLPGESEEALADAFIQSIREMNKKMNIPAYIEEIKSEDIPLMAKRAAKEANPLYPVPVIFDVSHFEKVFRRIKAKDEDFNE